MTVSDAFHTFDDLNSFEEYWLIILFNVPQFGFVWYFSHDSTGIMDFGEKDHRGELLFITSHQGYILSA